MNVSSKLALFILTLSVFSLALVFLVSAILYIYRRDLCLMTPIVISSDKETSENSATNLIDSKINSNADLNQLCNIIRGCFRMGFFLFRSNQGVLSENIIRFSYSDLEHATQKFLNRNIIGLGGSSSVYRGQLVNGRIVAVKRLNPYTRQEADATFLREIELLSKLHHCNVLPLVGYCLESRRKHRERLLVFDCMTNGNLRDFLDGVSGKNMDWNTRVGIAIGAARGLEYLHQAAKPRILHRDIKSTNILLDENLNPKITDFGMARSLRSDDSSSCSSSPARIQGTFGYFAPEYAIVGRASLESDVFSFGVVLLELITGRRPIKTLPDKRQESLVIWATPRLIDSKRVIEELPDPRLCGNFSKEDMQIVAYLAKECLLLDPDSRPTMSEIVQVLLVVAQGNTRLRCLPTKLSHSYIEVEESTTKEVVCTPEEIKHANMVTWSNRFASPLICDTQLVKNGVQNPQVDSFEHMGNICFMPGKDIHRDGALDLVLPQFEFFHMDFNEQ